MRRLIGVGTPRGLQGRLAVITTFLELVWRLWTVPARLWTLDSRRSPLDGEATARAEYANANLPMSPFTTGC